MTKKKMTIEDLYDEMFEAIKMVKEDEMPTEKAAIIADLGKVIVEAAKAETNFLKTTRQTKSSFLLDDETRNKLELEAKKALPENQKYFNQDKP